MPEFRQDPVTYRWVIISSERRHRPTDFHLEPSTIDGAERCPFCPGHEEMTPPEVRASRQPGGAPNRPGWSLRVIPNKFPALQAGGNLDRQTDGLFGRMNGIGAHEVIIETPDHAVTLATMSEGKIERVLWAYRERLLDLRQDQRFRHILIFKNHGPAAGATLEHSHSQLVALPIVPDFVREEVDGGKRYFSVKQRCVFCDLVEQESAAGRRIVHENAEMIAVAAYASRFPFETWLLPRSHGARFEEASEQQYRALAETIKFVLTRMNRALQSPSYNLIIHSSPLAEPTAQYYHWHVEVIPKLTRIAGFEWGTGFYINPTAPEEAAHVLRTAKP